MRLPSLASLSNAAALLGGSQKAIQMDEQLSRVHSNSLTPLPGGTPITLCPASSPDDLFQITEIEMSKQPLYFYDTTFFHTYGVFKETWDPKNQATATFSIECGADCQKYGSPPPYNDSIVGQSFTGPFCYDQGIEQPLGRGKHARCPPEPGHALLQRFTWLMPFFNVPGYYNFTFDAKTADGRRIYCVTTEVCLRWEDDELNGRYPSGPWTNCSWPK